GSSISNYVNPLATFNVTAAAATPLPSSSSYQITVSPSPVAPGKAVTFKALLNPGVKASNATTTLWFYNSAGGYVDKASTKGVTFDGSSLTTVIINYTVPSTLPNGTYTYNL